MDRRVAAAMLISVAAVLGCQKAQSNTDEKVVRLPLRAYVKTTDPVHCTTKYDNQVACLIYETLVQYKYLKRPLELEPLLLAEMPEVSEDRKTYHFKLKKGVLFHDDPCFEKTGGKGRELVSADVFYSWKRMADNSLTPKGWWLFANTIVGFDEFRKSKTRSV